MIRFRHLRLAGLDFPIDLSLLLLAICFRPFNMQHPLRFFGKLNLEPLSGRGTFSHSVAL